MTWGQLAGKNLVNINLFDLGWLIGIIDGEGCFSLDKNNDGSSYVAKISIANTDPKIIVNADRILTKLGVEYGHYQYKLKSEKILTQIIVGRSENVRYLLRLVLPFMECRREEAIVLNKFCKTRITKGKRSLYSRDEHRLYKKLKQLKTYVGCLPVLHVVPSGLASIADQSEFDLGWFSAIVDGEGGLFAKKRNDTTTYDPMLSICNTNFRLIEKVDRIITRQGLTRYFAARIFSGRSRRLIYEIEVKGIKRMDRFLTKMKDNLQCKKEQAELLHQYIYSRLHSNKNAPLSSEEADIVEKINKLNNPGLQDYPQRLIR